MQVTTRLQYGVSIVHERELGRELGVEEYFELAAQSASTERNLSLNRIRVRAHENPYARIPFGRRLNS